MPYRQPGNWLITGASSGFGQAIATAVLERGGRALLGARRTHLLDPLVERHPDRAVAQPLDVTVPEQVDAAVAAAVDRFGGIDVLVNNAGSGQLGAVEETADAELRRLFEVHVFAPAALVRAVLPVMRRQGGGAIVQMSSSFGRYSAPGLSAYSATKFALEGLSQALAAEVAPFGIDVLVVEPGAFRTGILDGAFHHSAAMPEYDGVVGPVREMLGGLNGTQPGDPAKAAAAIVTALGSEAPPLRLPLGEDAVAGVRDEIEGAAKELEAWESLARATAFDG
ncbi:SDR family NAD(P)-dependent oxidoreductase [Actinomadura fibrosa]|uniref:SDR family NAD(P)-dependent oxidoreductase n=1 Tax=Actinomadura fibrosa TaxID=111802 RepID=A0ABW2XSK6_9ACTN|nr:SDR family NAD(P)-dependent oxidoreductase [Actinomadura fibrosa]